MCAASSHSQICSIGYLELEAVLSGKVSLIHYLLPLESWGWMSFININRSSLGQFWYCQWHPSHQSATGDNKERSATAAVSSQVAGSPWQSGIGQSHCLTVFLCDKGMSMRKPRPTSASFWRLKWSGKAVAPHLTHFLGQKERWLSVLVCRLSPPEQQDK